MQAGVRRAGQVRRDQCHSHHLLLLRPHALRGHGPYPRREAPAEGDGGELSFPSPVTSAAVTSTVAVTSAAVTSTSTVDNARANGRPHSRADCCASKSAHRRADCYADSRADGAPYSDAKGCPPAGSSSSSQQKKDRRSAGSRLRSKRRKRYLSVSAKK